MKYAFPKIDNIEQVRAAITGRNEFIEADRGEFIVFNYLVCMPTTFEDPTEMGISEEEAFHRAIRRECRGLIFDAATGEVISRPFHKFFNVGEKIETEAHKLDLSKEHIILDKVDGSFIRPFRTADGVLRWGTKMGETEVAGNALNFVKNNPKFVEFGSWLCDNKMTGIFEWVSRLNRIVLDYPEDNLILLAVRHNMSGEYVKF